MNAPTRTRRGPVTAFVFPGLNGAAHADDHGGAAALTAGFRARWADVAAAFAGVPGFAAFDASLRGGRTLPEGAATWPWRALAVAAMQLGVAGELERRGERAMWLCSYSVGDLARCVHGGAWSWSRMVAFARALPPLHDVAGQALAAITASAACTDSLRAQLAAAGIDACRLSPRFLLLAGDAAALQRARDLLARPGVHVRDLGRCPLHSGLLTPLARRLAAAARHEPVTRAHRAMFSTWLGRAARAGDDLRGELTANVAAPVDFAHAVRTLHERHGVTRFVDLGPGRHAQRFVRHHDLPVVVEHALDLLAVTAASA